MSVQTPLRLLELAAGSLLKDEALAIAALEFLPPELFPPLFTKASMGDTQTLKAMVRAWPFVHLPLGGLMHTPHKGTSEAILDGLNALLTHKVHPRRCKLRVMDLRNTDQNFWRMWSGDMDHGSSSALMAPVSEGSLRKGRPLAPLEVFIELSDRKDLIHLCCKKLTIESIPIKNIMKFLHLMPLDRLQEVQVNCIWQLSTLSLFAPLLGQMRSVQRRILSPILVSAFEEQEQQVVQFTSQFLKLHHLRGLSMDCPSFLHGRLDQMLRCLKTGLENLAIMHCLLTESDLTHLSQCPSISQLKGLDLSGVVVTNFRPAILQILLEKVAATVWELGLDECGILDSQLEAILPALSLCFQLRSFSLRGNMLSMAAMEKLLLHTAGLPNLSKEFYPTPQESYSSQGVLLQGRLAQLQAGLKEIMNVLGQPRTIWLSSSPFLHCSDDIFYHMEPITYHCNSSAFLMPLSKDFLEIKCRYSGIV
ncbi:hypothetical protein FD755_011108 [Muntiacus reevesi]|uniref:Uncharacterized protein n=1 Tax=Muntiacus reevesi TaxID=9886 RepID=A0A5N3XVP7_MUNRE|nr:hypothetical protein FD755_011108 [Muntiacus reevesi]